jgi:MFS family permease
MEFTLAFLLAGEPFNLGPLGIAGVMVYVGVILILTQGFVVRRLVPKIGEAAGARFGLMLVASGLALLAWAPSIGWVYAAQTLAAVGAGLSNASLSALASLYASTSEQGRVSGLFRSLGSLSRALGPIIGAYVFWRLGAPVAYLGAAVLTAAALALAWPLPPAQSNVRDQEGGRGQVPS